MVRALRWMLSVGCFGLLLPTGSTGGQAPTTADAGTGTLTLHVYENLIQLPVLVLSRALGELPPLPASRFAVRLDDGPPFPATHVRREGDDPIALAVLLDAEDLGRKESPAFAGALGSLGEALRAEDRVAIYTIGCTLRGSAEFQPGTPEGVRHAMESGLKLPEGGPGRAEGSCGRPVGLWDALSYLIMRLRAQPGRRVILVASNGRDRGSRNSLPATWHFAAASAVTIFGVMDEGAGGPEHALDRLCALTGGLARYSPSKRYGMTVPEVIAMVRARYIVEFPRARDATAGLHSLNVVIGGSDALIRTSGIGVPVADPKVLADPTTVPNDATRAPTQGVGRPASSW